MEEEVKTEKKQTKKQNNKSSIFTRETLGVVLVLFATLCLICLISSDAIFSTPGKWVNNFLFGVFGYAAYLLMGYAIFMGVLLITDRKTGFSVKRKAYMTSAVLILCLIIHVITMHGLTMPSDNGVSYGEYLATAYNRGANGILSSTGGGLLFALISFWLGKILTSVGCYVVLGAIFCLLCFFIVKDFLNDASRSQQRVKGSYMVNGGASTMPSVETQGERDYPIEGVTFPNMNTSNQRLFVNNPSDFGFRSKREIRQEERERNTPTPQPTNNAPTYPTTYRENISQEMRDKLDYIRTPAPIVTEKKENNIGTTVSANIPRTPDRRDSTPIVSISNQNTTSNDSATVRAEDFYDRYATFEADGDVTIPVENSRVEEQPTEPQNYSVREENIPFIEETEVVRQELPPVVEETPIETPIVTPIIEEKKPEEVGELRASRIRDIFKDEEEVVAAGEETIKPEVTERVKPVEVKKPQPIIEEKPQKPKPPINRKYNKPPIDLLETRTNTEVHEEDHETREEIIKKTLGEFHINVENAGHIQGPTITRYAIKMPAGIPVRKVLSYDDDLKMRLAVKDGVRIEAPIPGQDLVGVEVANKYKTMVGMREVLEGMTKKKISKDALEFAIGKDIVGNAISDNLAKGPHFLVAGATGSGKSVCLNVMLVSLIMRYSPEELRLILIDPKMVGFRIYEKLPHLLVPEIITEPQKALTALSWAIQEMENRYEMFTKCDGLVNDIESYNEHVASDTVPKMARIVIMIDELADLMETCKKDFEARIRRLAQKARAAGIHLVLATQRPSVDIITGTIKTNLPSRIALKVMNAVDSITILGEAGAEKLLGNGDMIYKSTSMSTAERYQGAFISNREINNIVTFIKENNEAYFDEELNDFLNKANAPRQEENSDGGDDDDGGDIENDELFVKAVALVIQQGQASISQLKRKFPIGYSKAGRLIDKMETLGYISGFEGSKPRRVLITREEFEQKYGDVDD